jgi:hypothetical protein
MPGGGGREGVGDDLAVQVGAFLSGGVTRAVMPGPGVWEQPALPGSAGRGYCPGGTMIDWVSPSGVVPLGLIRPPAWPWVCAHRPAAAGSGSAGAGRGGPHRVNVAAVCPAGPRDAGAWSSWNRAKVQAAGSASPPGSARMGQACRTILRASDGAARLVFVRSATAA